MKNSAASRAATLTLLIGSSSVLPLVGCAARTGATPSADFVPASWSVAVPEAGTSSASSSLARAYLSKPMLDGPIGLAVSPKNYLYVANHSGSIGNVLVYNGKNRLLGNATITAGIDNPADLTFDRSGNLYVTNYDNQTVTVYDSAGKWIKSRTLHTDSSYNPSGVQVDGQGRVWVANRTNGNITIGEIQVFNKNGKVIAAVTQSLVYPLGIVFSPKTTDAWIANSESPNDDMAIYTQNVQFVKTISTPSFTPTYLAYAKSGLLYATNGLGSDLEVFSSRGKRVRTISTGLNLPYGIAFNKRGYFYVANVGNNTITEYNGKGKLVATIK